MAKTFIILIYLVVTRFCFRTICLDSKHRKISKKSELHNCVYHGPHTSADKMKKNVVEDKLDCNYGGQICLGCCYKGKCRKVMVCNSILQKKHEVTLVFFLVTSMCFGFFAFVLVNYMHDQRTDVNITDITRIDSELDNDAKIRAQYSFAYLQEHASQLSFFDINLKIKELNSVHSLIIKRDK